MDKIKHKYILKIILIVLLVTITWLVIMSHNTRILGDGYWYESEGKRIFGPDIDIPPTAKIVECTRGYIIVEQYPPEREDAIYEYEYTYPYGRDTTYYWIIYKKEHSFIGPLVRSELDSILEESGINL